MFVGSSTVLRNCEISGYSYWQWQLTRMREKKEFEPANRGSVFLLQSGCKATAWQCWLPVIAGAGLQSKCSNRIITDSKYHLTHHTEFVNKQLFNFSPLKLVGFHLNFSLIFFISLDLQCLCSYDLFVEIISRTICQVPGYSVLPSFMWHNTVAKSLFHLNLPHKIKLN